MCAIQPKTEREPGFWLGVPFSGGLEVDGIKNGGETLGIFKRCAMRVPSPGTNVGGCACLSPQPPMVSDPKIPLLLALHKAKAEKTTAIIANRFCFKSYKK